jgi:hypothetical protein
MNRQTLMYNAKNQERKGFELIKLFLIIHICREHFLMNKCQFIFIVLYVGSLNCNVNKFPNVPDF